VDDLFSPDYFEQAKRLDFAKPGPVTPPMRWGDYLRHETQRFKDDLGRVVDKYAMYLDPDTINVAEQLLASHFISLIERFPDIRAVMPEEHRDQPYPLLLGMGDMMREYISAFAELVGIYNSEAPEDRRVTFGEHMWQDNVSPQIGSARVEISTDDTGEEGSDSA
jgi:hypothetical protein